MPRHEFHVAMLDDLAPGGMTQVDMDGQKVLLVRDGDAVHAVSTTCPHAGAPLAEGVLHAGRVVCPWHKAAFCIRTGAVLDPPALDALRRFDVRLDHGRILLARPADAPTTAQAAAADDRCFVIVGAGGAGAVAAQTLRQAGFSGRVVMLDPANRVPYDRTVLSKYALSGQKGAEKSPLQTQAYYRQHRIERRTAEVTHLDAPARRLICADGAVVEFDAVLLATGGKPARPSIPGAGLTHVHTLRSRADADAILAQAERSVRAVVLGASFIGMEVAASLRERGLDVTVVGQEAAPFARQLGEEVGAAFVGLHEQHRVAFRLGHKVAALEGAGHVTAVVLETGERIPADLVVVGFGVKPSTSYADGLKRNEDGGVIVDPHLRAADGVYAAGDIASFRHRGDGELIRVEHWRVAEQQGRVAALNMMGRPTRYDAVPVFWTIHYMKRLDYVGHAAQWDSVVLHGDVGKPEFIAYYVVSGRVAAAAGLGRDRDMAALIELFTLRRDWTADELGESPATVLAAAGPPTRGTPSMPQTLEGSCRCGAVRFTCDSHTPVPYQRCYCTICRKTAGGGGYAINLGVDATTLNVKADRGAKRVFRAQIMRDDGQCHLSTAERHFCARCATALWLFSPEWPDLLHPFASAIDSELPIPPMSVHLMLRFKASWVEPQIGPDDATFDLYPEESIEDWHRNRGLWVD